MLRNEEIDQLTGLSNLYSFRAKAQKMIDDPELRKKDLVIIYFDVENFKAYNAKFGFEAGDRFLQNMSKSIKKIFQELLVARFSDDHFVVLAYANSIEARINDVYRRVKGYNPDADVQMKAGVYELEYDDSDISMACDKARMACASIKNSYDVIVRVYDKEIGNRINLANYIMHNVNEAILKGYIKVYYQPVVRVLSGKICGFEALARWIDPEHGFLMPSVFIPILEDAHLIYKLDAFVVRQVCEDIKEFTGQGYKAFPVSVNFSRADFHQRDMYRVVNEAVTSNDIPKSLIHIEITESALEDESGILKGTMDKFRQGGYQVWMDDFGSGYSSFNLLKDYEFDVLKFDMKFLQDFASKPRETAIWENIINMAEEIGIQTLAEGVETLETWDFLKRVGCEKAQGYFFGRPMSKEEVVDYLDEYGEKALGDSSAEPRYQDLLNDDNAILLEEDTTETLEEQKASLAEELYMSNSEMYTKLAAKGFAALLEYNSYSQFQKYSFFIVADLTNDKLLNLHLSKQRKILDKRYRSEDSYEDMIDEIVRDTVIQEEKGDVSTFFNRDRLVLAYHSGISSDDIEFHRIANVKVAPRWTHTTYEIVEEDGKLVAYFLSFDIDEYKKSKELVTQMAERDTLTGLYNRHTAVPLIRNRLYRRQKGKAAMIMMDVDEFRDINDRFGHLAGDEVLRRIAARLDEIFGRDGIVCHIDQDEFLVFVEDVEESDLKNRIDRFSGNVFEVRFHNDLIPFTVSCGYVIHPDHGRGYHDLYRKADAALCNAKSHGNGLSQKYDEG
ncbi:sensor domain-containing diguanylate cyclase [Butyrivibrio sp. AE3006]|uniref:sensor domain-containing diguanylate cyclase n=1 Tax=Butyrivibrio sp. AE3006 TaxID=1280673 RepID=UPI000429D832|nr:EAL domain-containing protein [Butyrivibrio sp. AE3006]